jgi:hypothetical protein
MEIMEEIPDCSRKMRQSRWSALMFYIKHSPDVYCMTTTLAGYKREINI